MLECKGVVQPLGPCPNGEWELKYNKAGIPYITDQRGESKKWAMAYFQNDSEGSQDGPGMPMNLSLDRVDEEPEFLVPVHKSQPDSSKKPDPTTPVMGVQSVKGAGADSDSGPGHRPRVNSVVCVCVCL